MNSCVAHWRTHLPVCTPTCVAHSVGLSPLLQCIQELTILCVIGDGRVDATCQRDGDMMGIRTHAYAAR
jgi:hypothetical protein